MLIHLCLLVHVSDNVCLFIFLYYYMSSDNVCLFIFVCYYMSSDNVCLFIIVCYYMSSDNVCLFIFVYYYMSSDNVCLFIFVCCYMSSDNLRLFIYIYITCYVTLRLQIKFNFCLERCLELDFLLYIMWAWPSRLTFQEST